MLGFVSGDPYVDPYLICEPDQDYVGVLGNDDGFTRLYNVLDRLSYVKCDLRMFLVFSCGP